MPVRTAPPPLDLDFPTHRRPRSRTLTELDREGRLLDAAATDPTGRDRFDDGLAVWNAAHGLLGVPPRRRNAANNGSTSSLASSAGNASDSAYGTLDEAEDDVDGCFSPVTEEESEGWKDRVAETFEARSRRRISAVLGSERWRLRTTSDGGDGVYWRRGTTSSETAQSSPDVPQAGVFSFDLAYDADSSFDSLDSFVAPLSATSRSVSASTGSTRSSPEPSECGESDSATRLTIARRRRKLVSPAVFEEGGNGVLARRHTLPRRAKTRETAVKVSFAPSSRRDSRSSSSIETRPQPPVPTLTPAVTLQSSPSLLPPLTHTAFVLTALVSTASYLLPLPLVTPISPVHLRHASTASELALQGVNALLAPFLLSPSYRSLLVGAANLALLRYLEKSTPAISSAAKVTLAGALWAAIVGLRGVAGWVFGRILGWAHPELFSTRAIHEVGSGLAPLLLALYLLHSASSSTSKPPSYLPATILAASFATPVASGGAGLWLGICGALVGLVASLVSVAYTAVAPLARSTSSTTRRPSAPTHSFSFVHFLVLLTLPALAYKAVALSPKPAVTSAAFSTLHPSSPTLLTVLLMTAPRPGNPDFLVQTISSWLGAFPEPSPFSTFSNSTSFPITSPLPLSDRLRLVVYTHFDSHLMFDLAQSSFSSAKAQHYITWQRDPRAFAAGNRLDQRLHVARGLEYAASLGGAYVLLTEDDFPLCQNEGDGRSWSSAWEKLQAALVATNELMPDVPSLDAATPSTPGHCGLFLSTGGSGLAIRNSIAARLPALLLGSDDPHGYAREAAAARGEVPAQRGGKDADTPDLVIQDCLRGRLDECRDLCAPAARGATGPFLSGSARLPGGVPGERVGKSGLAGTERLLQRHLGYNASTLPGREYGKEEWACGWRQPFNGEPDILTV